MDRILDMETLAFKHQWNWKHPFFQKEENRLFAFNSMRILDENWNSNCDFSYFYFNGRNYDGTEWGLRAHKKKKNEEEERKRKKKKTISLLVYLYYL